MKICGDVLKKKLKQTKPIIGGWITMSDPIISEIMVQAGFEWLAVDMEHSALSLQQVQNHVRTIELSGIPSLVRVEKNDANFIKKAMDTGASGVIVPMVNTREDAERAVEAVRYPPKGNRGVGLARAQGYGMEFEEYYKWLNTSSIVVIQIEHIDAVNNIDEILQVEGIDSFIVGPFDLSGSIGHPGKFDHPKVKAALKKVMAASKKHKIPAGFHVIPPDANVLKNKIKEGFQFVAFSLDTLYLATSSREALNKVKKN